MKSIFSLGITCLSFGILACPSEPELLEISSTQAALTAADNSERALAGIFQASDFIAGSRSMAKALGLVRQTAADCTGAPASNCDTAEACAATDAECGDDDSADLDDARLDLKDRVDALVRTLRERILIEDNLEVSTATSATYLLGPDVLCADPLDAPVHASAAGSGSPPDPDCVSKVERLQPRLRLTSPRENDVDITLLLGEDQNAPLTFQLYQHSLGVQVNLAEALAVGRDLGQELEGLQELSGVLQLQLIENQPRDYAIALNVLNTLHVVTNAGGESMSASLGASSPALSLRADGNARRLTASVGLGALALHGPLRWLSGMLERADADEANSDLSAPNHPAEPRAAGAIDIFLAGLSGSLSYVADSDILNVDDIGLGGSTSTIKYDGKTLLAVDLNAEHGRRVNLKLEPLGEATKVSISPTLDLSFVLAFRHVTSQFASVSEALLDNTVRVWFAGDAPTFEVSDEQLRVSSGTLHLDSSADAAANLAITTGMCLVEAAEPEQSQSAFARFEASSCE
jgi:hypothetical protein